MTKVNKLIAACCVSGAVLSAGMIAQAADASAGVDIVSSYNFRGATVNDELNAQPSLEGSFFDGALTLGTWGNFNTDVSQLDEIDYYGSVALPLEDSPVGVSIGYTEYTYPTLGADADREVNVGFELVETAFSPYASVNIGIEGPLLDEGLYIEVGGSHELYADDTATITASLAVGYEAGDNVPDSGISHVTGNLTAGIGNLSLFVNYVFEADDDVLVVDDEVWGGAGISIPFE